MKKNKIYAMIPARAGSTRLKTKNIALIDGISSTAVESIDNNGSWLSIENTCETK